MRALLLAVESRLQTALSLTSANVGVQLDGIPPPFSGQLYVAVHPGGFTADDTGLSLHESYDLSVTVSMRAGYAPKDRIASDLGTTATTGIYARAEAIRAALHMNEATRAAANVTIGAGENGFYHPLKFRSATPPQWQGSQWFGSEEDGDAPDGVSITLSFGGAMRAQVIEEQS